MRNIFLSAALLLGLGLSAQSADSTANSSDKYQMWKNRHAIAFHAGLPGYGLEYAYNLNRSFNVRLAYSTFAVADISTDLEINGQSVNVNASASSSVVDLLFEYQPSSNVAFKLVGGISYLGGVGVNPVILLNDDIGYGDLIIANEDIGEIDLDVTWSGIAPYIGFGFGRAVPKKRVGFGLEFGTYYAGGPDVTIVATDMLQNTSEEAEEMEENLASYAWVPRIMARLAIKL